MIEKQSVMRPQDVVILLKKMTTSGRYMTGRELSMSLGISQSEISEAMERNSTARLVDSTKSRINILSFRDFLISGLKYCFPAKAGSMARGIPTAVSASPISDRIVLGNEVFIWKDKSGSVRGQSVIPLYHTVPYAIMNDSELYALLVIVDTLRIGRAREREIAIEELDKIMDKYAEIK